MPVRTWQACREDYEINSQIFKVQTQNEPLLTMKKQHGLKVAVIFPLPPPHRCPAAQSQTL